MKIYAIIALCFTTTSFIGPVNNEGKWEKIFDGKTTNGWHSYGKKAAGKAWTVEDGALKLQQSKLENGYQTADGGDLLTDEEYENFELMLEWKISKNGNSGIIFYVKEDPTKYRETWNTGIECQVLDILGNEDSKSHKHDVGDLYDLVSGNSHSAKPFNEWNKVHIKSINDRLQIYLNDILTIDATLWNDDWKHLIAQSKFKDMPAFGTFKKGRIALQDHGNEVWYRNIMIKKL